MGALEELQPVHFATTPEEAERLSVGEPYAVVAVNEMDGMTFIGRHTVNRPAKWGNQAPPRAHS